jgi:hypothetical protein
MALWRPGGGGSPEGGTILKPQSRRRGIASAIETAMHSKPGSRQSATSMDRCRETRPVRVPNVLTSSGYVLEKLGDAYGWYDAHGHMFKRGLLRHRCHELPKTTGVHINDQFAQQW